MAKIELLAPFILSWEGGFVNDKNDRGGATNKGVTLTTWKSCGYDIDADGDIDIDDLRLITADDVITKVLKPHYWDALRADEIKSQAVANILVDWAYNSGPSKAAKAVQKIVGTTIDGCVGPKTIHAINQVPYPSNLFTAIKNARLSFINKIVENDPSQRKFYKGWLNRINSIEYYILTCNGGKTVNV